jgi:hypothetical protein
MMIYSLLIVIFIQMAVVSKSMSAASIGKNTPSWSPTDSDGIIGKGPPKGPIRGPATALYVAARAGQLDCVKYLLSVGANPDKGTMDTGETPLTVAAINGYGEVVSALLAAGAAPLLKSKVCRK